LKSNLIYILILIIIFAIKLNAYTGSYYEYYENLSNEPTSALSSSTGQNIFDFLPVDLDNLNLKNKLLISSSLLVLQGGDEYGPDSGIERMENIDFAKSFSIVYNFRQDLMPFISFYTPYKQVLDKNLVEERIKKRDVLSIGWISELGRHQIVSSFDYLISTYKQGVDFERYANGFSARLLINIKVNPRSSMFFGAISKSFLEFDVKEEVEKKYRYFNSYEGNAGFNYKTKLWYCVYSMMYRSYEIFYDEIDGAQLNYPWVIEHKIIFGKHFYENLTGSISYELLPSSFTGALPDLGDKLRHTVGVFVGLNLENINLNFSYHDSKFLSEGSLGKSVFQMDLVYKLR